MTLDPRVGFWISIAGVIVGVLAAGGTQLTTIFGAHTASVIMAVSVLLMTMISGANAVLHMIPSGNSPADLQKFMLRPSAPDPSAPLSTIQPPPAAKVLIILAILLTGLLVPSLAFAQQRPKDLLGVPGGVVGRAGASQIPGVPSASQEDPLQALADKFNADLAADLTSALALASQTDAKGNAADQTAIPCYQALIDLNKTINGLNIPPTPPPAAGTTPATPAPDGPKLVTKFEKIRIVKNAITNQTFKDACAPLVQDIQQSANQFLGQIFAVIGGAAKLGIGLP